MKIFTGIAALLCFASTQAYSLCQHLGLGNGRVYIVSAFDAGCYFTTFNREGAPLWEVSFRADIVNWKADEADVFVFSKAKDGSAYFLTCINEADGNVKWERLIAAPAAN
jgi:hypothetical protein